MMRSVFLFALMAGVVSMASQAQMALTGRMNAMMNQNASPSVQVSGIVYHRSQLAQGSKRSSRSRAAGVTVRFWQPNQPAQFVEALTDDNGEYQIELSEGAWLGAACGNDKAYSPSHWRLHINNKQVTFLEPNEQSPIRIASALSSSGLNVVSFTRNAQDGNHNVTVSGSGFGCAGKIRFIYHNQVDLQGDTQDVEYGVNDVVVGQFISRTNNSLTFAMPLLRQDAAHLHIANMRYEQGANHSNAILIEQQYMEVLPPEVVNASDNIAQGSVATSQDIVNGSFVPVTSGFGPTVTTISQAAAGTPANTSMSTGVDSSHVGSEPNLVMGSGRTITGAQSFSNMNMGNSVNQGAAQGIRQGGLAR